MLYLRPNLGSRLWNHGEPGSVIVEAHPGDLLERVQGGDQPVEGADVFEFRLEPHGGQELDNGLS